jgi:hypothetical protein
MDRPNNRGQGTRREVASFREVLPFPVGGVHSLRPSPAQSTLSDALELERAFDDIQLRLTELANELDEADRSMSAFTGDNDRRPAA